MQTRLHVCAAVAAIVTALPNVYAGENLAPSIDGVSNGTSLKYNQNCLDIAYKNAYGEASGKPTSESDFKNYRCYVGKKVVPCTSMSEDGQTKKAEADYQDDRAETAYDFEGEILVAYELNTNTAWKATNQYGYINFCRLGSCQILGSNYPNTTKNPLADLKCYDRRDTTPRCEVAIATDVYKTLKGKASVTIEINGVTTKIPVMENRPNGYADVSIGGNVYAGRTMYYELLDADQYKIYEILKNSVGSKLKYKISWE